MIKWLTDEFGLEVDQRTIRRVAMEEWALFDRAKVRLYVCTISWRLARLRLIEHLQGLRTLDDGIAAHDPSNIASGGCDSPIQRHRSHTRAWYWADVSRPPRSGSPHLRTASPVIARRRLLLTRPRAAGGLGVLGAVLVGYLRP